MSRWRIFRRPIIATPKHAVVHTKAAVMLHNFLRSTKSSVYCPPGFTDMEDSNGNVVIGTWQKDSSSQGLEDILNVGSNYHSLNAAKILGHF